MIELLLTLSALFLSFAQAFIFCTLSRICGGLCVRNSYHPPISDSVMFVEVAVNQLKQSTFGKTAEHMQVLVFQLYQSCIKCVYYDLLIRTVFTLPFSYLSLLSHYLSTITFCLGFFCLLGNLLSILSSSPLSSLLDTVSDSS